MDYIKQITEALNNIVNSLKEEMQNFRTNRPTTKLIENVMVDYMGTPMELRQLAAINVEPPRDLIVSPWDKSTIPAIESALQDNKAGLSVIGQAGLIRVKLPDLTEDRKKELVKVVKNTAEQAKIRVRMTRDDFNKRIKDIPNEDARFKTKDNIQKAVDRANEQIDMALNAKIKEVEE